MPDSPDHVLALAKAYLPVGTEAWILRDGTGEWIQTVTTRYAHFTNGRILIVGKVVSPPDLIIDAQTGERRAIKEVAMLVSESGFFGRILFGHLFRFLIEDPGEDILGEDVLYPYGKATIENRSLPKKGAL